MEFNAATNKTVLNRYLALKQPDNITQCMYVWIDGTGEHLRAKTKTVKFVPKKPAGECREQAAKSGRSDLDAGAGSIDKERPQ